MKKRKAPDGTAEPCSGVGGGDRLSCLPDELIGRILSFLPTPQAALTAQLSRRWRRAWAHVAALNLSVQDCVRSGKGPRFCALATAALARFPTPVIPAISVEVDHHIYLVDEWYGRAMARAVGSVRVTSLRGLNFLRLPPCTHAEALDMTAPRTTLTLPDPEPEADLVFGRLAELSLALLQLGGARPLDEFLASCCPRLRTLRLRRVRGHPVRRLALRTGTLEVLDLDTVDDLATLDVVAAKLRCLSVRSCFRLLPRDGDGDGDGRKVTVSAPRIEAICWYRSYPEQLTFRDGGLEHVRRLAGPLKLPTLGRRDQFDAPHTTQLLRSCALAVDRLDMELVVPDEMALLNWLGAPPAAEARATCEDLIRHVPALPCVRVLSLKIRWGFGGGVGPCLASFLSRTPSLTRLRIDASTYCLTVYVSCSLFTQQKIFILIGLGSGKSACI